MQILIDRMESNPEDFVRQPGYYTNGDEAPRFMHIADALESILAGNDGRDPFMHLTADEKAALLVAYRKMARQAFTAYIIAQVFGDEEKRKRVLVKPKFQAGVTRTPIKAEGADAMVYYHPINELLRNAIAKQPR